MVLKWTDVLEIAIELEDAHPDVDLMHVNFVDLRNWVMALDDFDDDPEHCGERILEVSRWPGLKSGANKVTWNLVARRMGKA